LNFLIQLNFWELCWFLNMRNQNWSKIQLRIFNNFKYKILINFAFSILANYFQNYLKNRLIQTTFYSSLLFQTLCFKFQTSRNFMNIWNNFSNNMRNFSNLNEKLDFPQFHRIWLTFQVNQKCLILFLSRIHLIYQYLRI